MPESDIRQTMILHQTEYENCDDPWELIYYGDGWYGVALTSEDQERIERRPGRRALNQQQSPRGRVLKGPWAG